MIGTFDGVDETYKKGFVIMQIAMQYMLGTLRKFQEHILMVQKNCEIESTTNERLKALLIQQVI